MTQVELTALRLQSVGGDDEVAGDGFAGSQSDGGGGEVDGVDVSVQDNLDTVGFGAFNEDFVEIGAVDVKVGSTVGVLAVGEHGLTVQFLALVGTDDEGVGEYGE